MRVPAFVGRSYTLTSGKSTLYCQLFLFTFAECYFSSTCLCLDCIYRVKGNLVFVTNRYGLLCI